MELGKIRGNGCFIRKVEHPALIIQDYWNGKIPFITGADVTELFVSKARSFLTDEGLASGKTEKCDKGDLIIVSRTRVGRIGIADATIGVSQDADCY